jgi:hypothetical protein
MWSLALTLVLAQADAVPLPELPEPPRELRVTPQAPAPTPPSVLTRSLAGTGLGALAGAASFGISYLLVGQNAAFDPTFSTAALGALLITGVAFTVHEALGGRGEITLGFLLCAVVMAGSAGLALAIDSSRTMAPILTVAIGSVPAAAAAVFGLEASTPQKRSRVQVAFAPNGLVGRF